MHWIPLAFSLAFDRGGKSKLTRIAITAMTTRSSTSVNPLLPAARLRLAIASIPISELLERLVPHPIFGRLKYVEEIFLEAGREIALLTVPVHKQNGCDELLQGIFDLLPNNDFFL